jgi:hypothetical protein
VDELHPKDLKLYMALVVVLAKAGEGAQSLDLFAQVITTYRARRPDGLQLLLGGERVWWQVGVVQVLHDGAAPPPELVRAAHGAVCRYMPVHDEDDLRPFAAYETGEPVRTPEVAGRHASAAGPLRTLLAAWGVGWHLVQVAEVRQFIERQRDVFENTRYFDLRRPVSDDHRNRLDFVLDDPAYKPDPRVCDGTKWTEGGKRVVNKVLGELKMTYPAVGRPATRQGRKNLQKEFHEFYRALRVAEQLLASETGNA